MFDKGWVVTAIPYGYRGVKELGPLTKKGRPRQAIAPAASRGDDQGGRL